MLSTGDTAKDAALADALASRLGETYARVMIDWAKDGSYGSRYADLSTAVAEVSVDRSFNSNLPDGVNAVAGFASARMDLTLGGNQDRGTSVRRLFDPYDPLSPTASTTLVGTPITLEWVTRTALGDAALPGFTGHVQSYSYRRVDGTVSLVCVDNWVETGASVTLPRWAVASTSPTSAYGNGPDWSGAENPISGKWVLHEVLRQLGAPMLRVPRPDAVSYQSMIGSPLPSYGLGRVDNWYQLRSNISTQPWQYGSTGVPALEEFGGNTAAYGQERLPVDKMVRTASVNLHTANRQVFLPQNAGDPAQEIGFVANWYRANAAGADPVWRHRFYLEDFRLGEQPYVSATVYEDPVYQCAQIAIAGYTDGTIQVYVRENWASGYQRSWTWTTPTSTAMPVNISDLGRPHEIWVKVRFAAGGVIPEVRFNGVVQALTPGSGNSPSDQGVRYRDVPTADINNATNGGPPRKKRGNVVQTDLASDNATEFPYLFAAEWFAPAAGVTAGYQAKPAFPVQANGKPYCRYLTQYYDYHADGWLHYLPEVSGREGWEVLKNYVEGIRGLMWKDEHGALNIGDATLGQLPAIRPGAQTEDLTLDSFADITVNPSSDNRRNKVIVNGAFRGSGFNWVYRQQSARDKYTPANTALNATLSLPAEAVMVNSRIAADTPPANEQDIDIMTGHCSAVNTYDFTADNTQFQVDSQVTDDPRFFKILWANLQNSNDNYTGSYPGGNQGYFLVSGRVLSEAQPIQGVQSDAASIAEIGARVLSLDTTDWIQNALAANAIAKALLGALSAPAPIVDDLEVPANPRRQVFDVVRLATQRDNEPGAELFAQVLSKTTRWSASEYTDTLKLRALGTPGAGVWDAAVWDSDQWS
ncbi:hypothetical protein CU254_14675 [Amycolatopsis sp. AA4]|uniref:hypothetical protein n=1 Tax=Actinomycetes TaxID=1760 RepID=UPI0001B54AD2|nr:MULTISPECIES: hypothetical protein [Actinomycetes]ATY11563.1 hypothetical protein CU254_14675 [Amycolatopsis sp. AA4]